MDLLKSLYVSSRRSRSATSLEKLLCGRWLDHRFPSGGIVVGGCGRSGTTLLIGMLSAHSQVCTIPEETWALYPSVQPLRVLKAAYCSSRSCSREAHWWSEKTPRNIKNVPEIIGFLKDKVRILHIVRDGRDVVSSRHPITGDYWVPISRWIEDVTAGLEAEEFEQVMRVYYEDLVRAPEQTLCTVLRFLNLSFEEQILMWEYTGTLQTHRAWSEGAQPLHTHSVAKYRRPEHREVVSRFMAREDARALLIRLGYEI